MFVAKAVTDTFVYTFEYNRLSGFRLTHIRGPTIQATSSENHQRLSVMLFKDISWRYV